MSSIISIFLKEKISKENFFDFLIHMGGYKQSIGNLEQGVLESGDSTIWLYYRGESFNLDNEELFELNNIIQDAKTEIVIEISSEDGSSLLAKDFCEKISQQFGTLALYNEEGIFFQLKDINKALYIK
ncbi:hypothetical protein [Acetivibrio clariflavus]|uniref:hypothetical protein n=1 Tax=Acetivibrio clariflavus TaxID=288965 RepID=UPI000488566B|nr:hypothetical protein [Acetivibrio clariflavus]